MIIRKVESRPFTIKLKTPFKNSNIEITKREGLIIKITEEYGNIGYGEVSPLPGLSEESLEDIVPIVKDLERKMTGSELDSDIFQSLKKYPSVEFGVSQALHSIFILRDGLNPKWNMISTISVNGIIGMVSHDDALKRARQLTDEGFQTIKIKVGRDNIEDDIKLVKSISENLNSSINYRLDVNGKWDVDKTIYAVEQFEGINIEYLEQPVSNIEELKELAKISKIPIAADESIRNMDDVKRFLTESNIQYFVIKPSLMGSITETINLLNLIQAAKRRVIISSAFESSIGRSALVFLASLVQNNSAHGLAVASYFSSDIAEDDYPIMNGKISFD
ncbi:O-succinylbenzoate synthase, partial [hydrothermal vent metagenome]